MKFFSARFRCDALGVAQSDVASRHDNNPACGATDQPPDKRGPLEDAWLLARSQQTIHAKPDQRVQADIWVARDIESAMKSH